MAVYAANWFWMENRVETGSRFPYTQNDTKFILWEDTGMSPKLSDERKERRRQQILEAAKRVFAEKGFGAATLKDIIEEAGMSRGWIYLYYPTKEEIFEALLDHQDADHERYLAGLEASSTSVWELISASYSMRLNEWASSSDRGLMPAFYEYFLVGWRDEARRELLRRRYEKGIVQFAGLLQTGIDRGEFNPVLGVLDISRLAASFQEGIVTHTYAVGAAKANSPMQIEALLDYLKSLLRPATDSRRPSREETL